MSLLSICQDAADRIGLETRPTAVIGSPDPDAQRLVSFATATGRELAQRVPWQALRAFHTWTALAAETQTGAIPAGFLRFVPDSIYDVTNQEFIVGPIDPAEYMNHRTMNDVIGARRWATRQGNNLLVWPVPVGGETYRYVYQSENFCTSSGGTPQNAWLADTDVSVVPEELITLGVVWRFLLADGQPYADTKMEYTRRVALLAAQENTQPRVMIAGDVFGPGRYGTGEPGQRPASYWWD